MTPIEPAAHYWMLLQEACGQAAAKYSFLVLDLNGELSESEKYLPQALPAEREQLLKNIDELLQSKAVPVGIGTALNGYFRPQPLPRSDYERDKAMLNRRLEVYELMLNDSPPWVH